MNWDILEGKWKQISGAAKSRWGKLTDDEIAEVKGDREALIGKVQEHYGLARDEAEKEIDAWAEDLKESI